MANQPPIPPVNPPQSVINTINDPLYIASSDHPGMALTNTQFNGSNFHGWSRNVKMALGAKLKLGFIDGSCAKPNADDVDIQSSDHPGMALTNTQFNGSNFHGWSRNVKMALGAKLKLGFIDETLPVPNTPLTQNPDTPTPTMHNTPDPNTLDPTTHNPPDLNAPTQEPSVNVQRNNRPTHTRKSSRQSSKPSWLKDFVTPHRTNAVTTVKYPLFGPDAFKVSEYGPYWDHVLGFWRASLESPDKILFLKYEEIKKEPEVHVKRSADFMGVPISAEEENGVVEKIAKFCSFEHLKNLEVNKTGIQRFDFGFEIENRHFFRQGLVGDWKHHMTQEMGERIDRITQEKFQGSGLTIGASPK
ncbi:sulfotransferase 16 [Artemisia annua]|uniref:Sulfotransferase n=1 Tax=Artemisia annua TaxID=35608 RepID=A0A2U1N0P7_ARTAN|nr:sulfotransferase 16 [Artemisia annua]